MLTILILQEVFIQPWPHQHIPLHLSCSSTVSSFLLKWINLLENVQRQYTTLHSSQIYFQEGHNKIYKTDQHALHLYKNKKG